MGKNRVFRPRAGRLIFLALAMLVLPAQAAVIPASRSIEWAGHAGVPGGIPRRAVVFATIDASAYGTGAVDASAAINSAIAACPEDQVVYLPAGTYRLDSPINLGFKSRITLRGAGMGRTILRPADGLGAAIQTGQTGESAEGQITGGAVKGSTSITVSDPSNLQAGVVMDLYQANDPDFYWARGTDMDNTGQYVMLTGVSGNAVQLEDPLVWTLSLNPRFRYMPNQGLRWSGVEDLTIEAGSTYGGSMIQFWNAYASWIKGVETAWGNGNEHIFLYGCLRCEIRNCYIHDTYSTTDGYGVLTMKNYGGGTRGGCTGMLVENNIFSGFFYATVLETEVGGVYAYNYARNTRLVSWPDYQIQDFNTNHSEHGMMLLFEGNAGVGFQNDGYHGSTSHVTLFRNYFSGRHVEAHRTGNIKTVDLTRFSYYHNVVGNVLGSPDWPRDTIGQYEMTGMPGYTEQAVIYRLGYPNMGNNSYSLTNPPSDPDDGGLDPKVRDTLMRWGNFDYEHNASRWEASEVPTGVAVPATHDLPDSLYYSSRPSWWPASIAWPPIGPDVSGLANPIPAQACYLAGGTSGQIGACLSAAGAPAPTGTGLPPDDVKVTAYPNPGRDRIVFQVSPWTSGNLKMVVFNLAGEKVSELLEAFDASSQIEAAWNCAGLAPGLYIAVLYQNGVKFKEKKVAVKK